MFSFILVACICPRILGRNLDDFCVAQMIKQIDQTNVPHLFAGTKDEFGDILIGVFVVYISSEKTGASRQSRTRRRKSAASSSCNRAYTRARRAQPQSNSSSSANSGATGNEVQSRGPKLSICL